MTKDKKSFINYENTDYMVIQNHVAVTIMELEGQDE